MRGRLLIFCGIPGSGKTTVAKIVAGTLPKAIHVQTDAVREMIAHPDFGGEESRFVYEGCIAVAREALRNGYTVLLDGTFMREEYRTRAKTALRKYVTGIDVVYIACGLEAALRRNSSRRAAIPPDKLRSIHRRFQAEPSG
ncbi:MAG: AAA family ATPase [Nitrososphaerales archaeon]|nr:AAA family ATPase [Nitrososphaerales archaeon]